MKRIIAILLLCSALLGCRGDAAVVLADPSPSPGSTERVESAHEQIVLDLTPSPAPLTPSPVASEAPTPQPTATPDPFLGLNVSFHAEDSSFYHLDLSEEIKLRITGMSYPTSGCKLGYDELRYIHLLYVDFEGQTHEGELIVNAQLADEVTDIFYQLYINGYPLQSVRLVDDYGEPAEDNLSMADNNTSGFNYRYSSGTKLSRHSYGCAIDINPMMNPYIHSNGRVSPPNGADWVDRSVIRTGMIDENDLCYQLFTSYGWEWGGHFRNEKDYQHFSKNPETLGY